MTTILKFFFWSDSAKGMAKVRLVGISLLVSFSFFSRFYWFGLRDESVMRWRDTQISRFLGFCGKKCTHRGCKILQCIFFCSAQKIKPFLNREHTDLFQCDLLRPMIMGLRIFFFENVHLIYDLQMQLSRLFELLSQLAGFVEKCSSVFICKILKVE